MRFGKAATVATLVGGQQRVLLPPVCTEVPPSGAVANSTFEGWQDISNQGFQGARVLEIKRQRRRQEEKRADPIAIARAIATRPLVLLFVLLTFGDFIFNFSRQFLCVLPDLCEAATY